MRRNTAWTGQEASVKPRGGSAIGGLLFVIAMGAAFWAGALWAAQPWVH